MIETVFLGLDAVVQLRAEARTASPAECCGLLVGREGRVVEVVPVRNLAASDLGRYDMDPAELWSGRRGAKERGLDVVGFYHSHPRTAPVPSRLDVDRAHYPDSVYVIVGLEPSVEIRAFRIANGTAREIVVHLEDPEPHIA